ncbi:MAG: TerB family tellurite resistance protein [Clostridiales bacterium]|nr:TerB family tellurite resistance protein [Candidatus Scatonaster coprocaballi]
MFGKYLLRSFTNDFSNNVLGGLGKAAAFGAGMVLVNELLNDKIPQQIPATAGMGNYVPQQATPMTGNSVVNIALARVALCYYIAKADGAISPEEQMDLDYMCSSLMNNPNASQSFRSELQSIMADRTTNFMNVEKYLNQLNVQTLTALQADMQRVAALSGGITENERKAMSVFQNYIYGKQGFPGSNMNEQFAGRANVISLKCSGCAADLEVNASQTET